MPTLEEKIDKIYSALISQPKPKKNKWEKWGDEAWEKIKIKYALKNSKK